MRNQTFQRRGMVVRSSLEGTATYQYPDYAQRSLWRGYPADWPACVSCGGPALDGHLTCGDLSCDEAGARSAAGGGR